MPISPTPARPGLARQACIAALALILLAGLPACAREGARPDPRSGLLLAQLPGQVQSLASTAQDAARGSFDAFDELASQRLRLQRELETLRLGDPARGLPPAPPAAQETLMALRAVWGPMDDAVGYLIQQQPSVLELADQAQDLSLELPQLAARFDLALLALAEAEARPAQLVAASRLVLLAERLQRRLPALLQGAEGIQAADRLLRECTMAGAMLRSLREGDAAQGLAAAEGASAKALDEAAPVQQSVQSGCEAVVEGATSLFEAREYADQIRLRAYEFEQASQAALAHWQ